MSSISSVAVDEAGQVLARAERRYDRSSPHPGWFDNRRRPKGPRDLQTCVGTVLVALPHASSEPAVSGTVGACSRAPMPLRRCLPRSSTASTRRHGQIAPMIQRPGTEAIAATGLLHLAGAWSDDGMTGRPRAQGAAVTCRGAFGHARLVPRRTQGNRCGSSTTPPPAGAARVHRRPPTHSWRCYVIDGTSCRPHWRGWGHRRRYGAGERPHRPPDWAAGDGGTSLRASW
jgi:hypothetical protein